MLKRYVALSALLVALASSQARAGFIVDPAGGTNLFDPTLTWDDSTAHAGSIGFTLNFFGSNISAIDVSTNGNINFSGDTSFSNTALPNGSARIDPLWDDLVLAGNSGESITAKSSAGLYYAVTWNMGTFGSPSTVQQFQAVLFGGDVVLDNFQFHANDIAFSYAQVSTPFRGNDATVGLNAGNNVNFSPLPGTTNGLIGNAQAGLLPTAAGSFLLFRPDGEGGYFATTQQADVPEPSTWLLSSIVALGGLGYLRRAKKKQALAAS